MNLRHLVFAYCLTWILQLGYLSFILLGWRRLRKGSENKKSLSS